MVSSMCGTETVTSQQKHTSFGASDLRDGVSYNEQEHKNALVEADDLANLAVGECYVLLPEPKARLSKVQIPEAKACERHQGFVAREESSEAGGSVKTQKKALEPKEVESLLEPEFDL